MSEPAIAAADAPCRCNLCQALVEAVVRAERAQRERRSQSKMTVVDGGKGGSAA
jgi:hypothetical protein